MALLFIIALVLVFCFSFVLIFGPPYLPTLSPQVESAFDLLDLKAGQTLIELGSGDGKIMLAAAKRGYLVVGYELNPLLYIFSLFRTIGYRKQVKVYCKNIWQTDWPKADGIFTFLLNRQMNKLDKRLKTYEHKPVKVASFAFKIPNKEISAQKKGVYLYKY
jgi:hypothetical protein